MLRPTSPPRSSIPPVFAQYASEDLVVGGGVAIFHLATQRVVLCSARDRRGLEYFFLPKGRRDAGEDSRAGAEREGYEEVRPPTSYIQILVEATRNRERVNHVIMY